MKELITKELAWETGFLKRPDQGKGASRSFSANFRQGQLFLLRHTFVVSVLHRAARVPTFQYPCHLFRPTNPAHGLAHVAMTKLICQVDMPS